MKKEKTFAIVHLSDLHIVAHNGNKYSTALCRMIDHISESTEKYNKIVIVFTGDLVEMAGFEDAEITIFNFFKDLKERLKDKIIDIVFAPGNHDKKRGKLVIQSGIDDKNEKFWQQFKNEEWDYFEKQFTLYKEIVNRIQKEIFCVNEQGDRTYGIKLVKVDDFNVCFMYMNSAWACVGSGDEGNLRIGRFQLDDLMNEYQNIKGDTNLVVALMHHPTDWMTKTEQKYLNQYMTDKYRLNTNILLQGHIHDKETYNWYNQNHSLTTLVTGMGWDQQKEINDGGHRYSLYEINMESCIIKVNTFVTDKGGKFIEDTDFYNGTNIVFPLYVHKFLELNHLNFQKSEIPLFYPNYNIAENISIIVNRINEFSFHVNKFLNKEVKLEYTIYMIIRSLLEDALFLNKETGQKFSASIDANKVFEMLQKGTDMKILNIIKTQMDSSMDIMERIKTIVEHFNDAIKEQNIQYGENILEQYRKFIRSYIKVEMKDKFYSFIGLFGVDLAKILFPEKEYEDGDVVRIHFRHLVYSVNEEILYKKLFLFTFTKKYGEEKVTSKVEKDTGVLTDIKYNGSMIQKSYDEKKAMLFSLNPSSDNHRSKGDWKDFLTISPNLECNRFIDKNNCDELTFPYISFGISVSSSKFQDILRGIAFIGFERILGRALKDFFDNIPFKIDEFITVSQDN